VSTGGIALVYKAGEIAEEALVQDSRVVECWVAAVGQELADLTRGRTESLTDIFFPSGRPHLGRRGALGRRGMRREGESAGRWLGDG
jgi:hypothetical protein